MDVSLAALVVILLYFLAYIVYQHFFSPLRNIPGPTLGRFSIFWQLWHLHKRDYHFSVQDVHREYGPCVRLSHYEVSVSDPEAVRVILLRPLRKHTWYKIFAMPDSSWHNMMAELDPQKFGVMAKKVSGGYTSTNILRSELEIDHAIEILKSQIDRLDDQGESVALDKWFTFFAFDLVGQMTFSKPFGFLEQGKDVENCIATSHRLVPYLAMMAYFHMIHEILSPLLVWLDIQPMRHVMDTTIQAVNAREKSDRVAWDMIEQWKNQKSGEPLTQRELLAAANANIAAGGEGIGTQSQALVYLLLKNPDCLQRLYRELNEAALNHQVSSPVQYSEALELPYFQACMKEAYRFHPVSATPYPRVAPKEGIEIAGRFFPSGTVISVSPWALHRDQRIFGADADNFNPDRWLTSNSKELERSLVTFGAGYMACPGRNLAHISLCKLLSTLFLEYEIELATPEQDWRVSSSLLARPHGWSVKMRKRQVTKVY
ncbi:cytochrome P450 [Bisporella sp. PMI_857]|nr:cytochrome P450 [Bisporella sp. PMI_857]